MWRQQGEVDTGEERRKHEGKQGEEERRGEKSREEERWKTSEMLTVVSSSVVSRCA